MLGYLEVTVFGHLEVTVFGHLEVRVSTLECGEEQWTKEHLSKSTGTFLGVHLHLTYVYLTSISDGIQCILKMLEVLR